MFLQRLVADEKIGFNYDHMGSSEFENGSTTTARELLARLIISGKMACKKVRLFTKWGINTYGPTEVFVFGHGGYLDHLITDPVSDRVLPDLVIKCDKENARQNDEKYLGWMKIEPYASFFDTLLIVRANKDCTDRGTKFLQMFVDQIDAAEKEEEDLIIAQGSVEFSELPKTQYEGRMLHTSREADFSGFEDHIPGTVGKATHYDKSQMANQSYGNRKLRISAEPEFGPNDPNPNNSDGLSDNDLRDRLHHEMKESGQW